MKQPRGVLRADLVVNEMVDAVLVGFARRNGVTLRSLPGHALDALCQFWKCDCRHYPLITPVERTHNSLHGSARPYSLNSLLGDPSYD